MSANSITQAVVNYLNLNGWKVWRQNNVGIYDEKLGKHRKPPKGSIKGVPDVIGYHKKKGVFIGVEVKAGKDKLSPEQEQFHKELTSSKGVSMVGEEYG